MKKLLFISTVAFAVLLTSCSNEDGAADSLIADLDLDSEATLESNYEDVDLVTEAGLETVDARSRMDRDAILDCAEITHDEENNTIVIDYGEGCEGPGGRIRAGIIRITYNDHRLVPGAFRTTTFDGFSLDGVLMEGTRTVQNISESLDDDPTFSITLAGGKLSFDDETTATRESQRVRTWLRGENRLDDQATVEGSSSGTKRDDSSYSVEILEKLVYKRSCWSSSVFIPVSGIKQYTSGDNVAVVDYGDGTCDNEVTITINDGEPITKIISPRGRK